MAWKHLYILQKNGLFQLRPTVRIVGTESQLLLKAIKIEWIWSSAELGEMSGTDGAGLKDFQNDFVISPASTNWKRSND